MADGLCGVFVGALELVLASLTFVIRNVNKNKRIAWCRGKLHWTVNNQRKKVMFTDEMMVVIKPDGKFKSGESRRKNGDPCVWAILHQCRLLLSK